MKLRCFQCAGPFGLTYRCHLGRKFCSQKCVDDYKLGRPRKEELPGKKPPEVDKCFDVC
jgi:hypothetical protein